MILILLTPLILILAVARLYQIPAKFRNGELRVMSGSRLVLSALGFLAYLVLLLDTAAILIGVPYAFVLMKLSVADHGRLIYAVMLYPALYVVAELCIYFGFQSCRIERTRSIPQSEFEQVAHAALHQHKMGSMPYAICPECCSTLKVARSRPTNGGLGVFVVACNCGECNRSFPV
jgi:hypothetical protein